MPNLKSKIQETVQNITEELKSQPLPKDKLLPIQDLGRDLSSDDWDVILFSLAQHGTRDLLQRFYLTRLEYEGKKRNP
tara:strand:- start:2761 stop:2994 length:234 start_codon:yes stop_codon:yes gene_type:complete